jgi:membrane protein
MATATEKTVATDAEKDVKQGAKSFIGLFNKFNNDWVMNFASALAFNLITAILPILIAILAIVGFTVGNLSPATETQLVDRLKTIFPASGDFLHLAFTSLSHSAGFLIIIAVLLAIFGGSRLFVSIEGYFDIIYHTRPRDVVKQNIMAVIMLLLFIVLTVPMLLASSIPATLQALSKNTFISQLPGSGIIFGILGVVVSLFVSWVLFEAIYIVVPNQHISFRNSWLGSVVAAVLLQIYLLLFPLYVTHFLGSYTGNVGLAVVLLFFFYYFAVILLIGAEINSYYAEGIQSTPDNLAVIVHKYTSHLLTTEKDVREQATPSHKNELTNHDVHDGHNRHTSKKGKSAADKAAAPTPRALVFVEAAAGTALAFVVQFFQLRRNKK